MLHQRTLKRKFLNEVSLNPHTLNSLANIINFESLDNSNGFTKHYIFLSLKKQCKEYKVPLVM